MKLSVLAYVKNVVFVTIDTALDIIAELMHSVSLSHRSQATHSTFDISIIHYCSNRAILSFFSSLLANYIAMLVSH